MGIWGKIAKEAGKVFLQGPMTLNYPFVKREVPEDFRGVIEHSVEKCIGCGNCARICPADAIEMQEDPKADQERTPTGKIPSYKVWKCITCGDCIEVCPTDALWHTKDYHNAEYKKEKIIWEVDKE